VVVAAGASLETSFLPQRLWSLRADYGVEVRAALSAEATAFVTELALRGVTGRAPYVRNDQWEGEQPLHLAWRTHELLLIVATARVLQACATGRVEDAPTRLFAFSPKDRVVVAPAVHPHLERRLYAPHVEALRDLGCEIVGGEDLFASWADAKRAIVRRLGLDRRERAAGPVLLEDLPEAAPGAKR